MSPSNDMQICHAPNLLAHKLVIMEENRIYNSDRSTKVSSLRNKELTIQATTFQYFSFGVKKLNAAKDSFWDLKDVRVLHYITSHNVTHYCLNPFIYCWFNFNECQTTFIFFIRLAMDLSLNCKIL